MRLFAFFIMKRILLFITALLLCSCSIEYVGNDLESIIISSNSVNKEDGIIDDNKIDYDNIDNYQIKLFDKVIYGRYQDNDLIWTVIGIDGNKVKLICDYAIDARCNEKRNFAEMSYWELSADYLPYEIESMFNEDEMLSIIPNEDNRSFGILDYEEYFELFKNKEDRVCLGVINGPYRGSKCYFVGGEGIYKKTVNACDENGDIYPAYDVLELPNRLVINVNKNNNTNIKKAKEKDLKPVVIDNWVKEQKLFYYPFIDTSKRNTKIMHISNDIVYKNDEMLYVDFAGNEIAVKDFNIASASDLRVGDIINYGYMKNEKQNKMIYRVVDIKNGTATFESVFSIFPDGVYNIKSGYKDSDLRTWLNEEFYKNYFSDDERSLIIKTHVDYDRQGTAEIDSIEDYIYTYGYYDLIYYYFNLNLNTNYTLEYEVGLNTKCYEEEYSYLNSEFVPENRMVYWNDSRESEVKRFITTYPNERTIYTIYGGYFRNKAFIGRGDEENNVCIVPIFRIKFSDDYDEDEVSHPDVKFLEALDKAFYIGKDLYYIDKFQNLNLIKDYNPNKKLHKNDIEVINQEIDKIYKIGDDIYYIVISKEARYDYDPSGKLYKKNKDGDSIFIYNDVYPIFDRIDSLGISFYVGAKHDYGSIDGKLYKYVDGELFNSNGQKVEFGINTKLKRATKAEDINKLYEGNHIIKYDDEKYFNINGEPKYYNPNDTFLYYITKSADLTRQDYEGNTEIIDSNVDNTNIYYNAIIYTKRDVHNKLSTYIYNYDKVVKVYDLPYDYNFISGRRLIFFELREYKRMKASELVDFEHNEDYKNNKSLYDSMKKILDEYETNFLVCKICHFDGENARIIDDNVVGFVDFDFKAKTAKYKKLVTPDVIKANARDILVDYKEKYGIYAGVIDKTELESFILFNIYDYLDTDDYYYSDGISIRQGKTVNKSKK